MIMPVDIFCLAIAVALVAGEAQRGIWIALLDFAGVLGAVGLAGYAYCPLAPWIPVPSTAYFLVLVITILAVLGLSIYLSYRTRVHVRNWECAAGAFVGLCTAITISHGVLSFITIKYGSAAPLVAGSLLAYTLADDGILHEMAEFMRLLTGT